MTTNFSLRDVIEEDLSIFFEHQLSQDANTMAAFTAKEPANRAAFEAHWHRILADTTIVIRTIVRDGQVVGHVLSYDESGKPEVSYWIGQAYWGQGIATWALRTFLADIDTRRPIYARAAQDNIGSIRVLEKCGFSLVGEANARGKEIQELVFELRQTNNTRRNNLGAQRLPLDHGNHGYSPTHSVLQWQQHTSRPKQLAVTANTKLIRMTLATSD